ncbi:MAG TPA: nucleoside hydrolase, partial [Acidimicrobiia bacterium]|nr:nucleoside hydrolase [Acidimicrobiia bacterium]
AVDVGGNVDGSGAEWNVFVDAAAASAVVASGLPVTLIPLDATNDVPVPPWYGRVLQEAPQSDAVRYLELMVRAFPAVTSGFFYLWDELAATAITEPGLLVTETASIEVVTGGSDHGVTRRSDTGTPVNIATGVPSPDDFYAEFLSTLAGEPVAVGRPPTTEESAYVRAFQDALRPVEGLVASWFDQLEEEEFDPAVWDDRLRAVFTAFADAGEEIRRLEPPEVFAEIHALYLEELDDFAVVADSDIFERIAGTTSLEELFSLFDEYELAESDACMLLIEEASILGVTIDFC